MILVAVLMAAIGACGKLPKPFQPPPDAGRGFLTRTDSANGVRVLMLEGPPKPMAKLLADSVAKDLVQRGIPATTAGGEAMRFTLKGKVEPLAAGAAPGKVARVHWSLTDRKDEPFFTFVQDVEGSQVDWQWGSPNLIVDVGAAAGRLIAEVVEPEDETLKPVTPVASGVWVKPIKGAPGDGDTSLTRAIRYALVGAKVAVTTEAAAARHVLRADVKLARPVDGKQNVLVRWTVTYPDGDVVGHAVQRNQVPQGTFDGRWGETASIIAAAAGGGIKSVLDRADETVRYRTASERRLKTDVVDTDDQPKLPPPELSPEPVLPVKPGTGEGAPAS